MSVTFEIRLPCPTCGYRNLGLSWRSIRVNKRSVRTIGVGLAYSPNACKECAGLLGWTSTAVSDVHLDAESAAKVVAYRQRHWPTAVPA